MQKSETKKPVTTADYHQFAPANFDQLPDSALLSARELCALLNSSINSVWRWSRTGALPAPIKLGQKTTRWNVGQIRAVIAAKSGTPA